MARIPERLRSSWPNACRHFWACRIPKVHVQSPSQLCNLSSFACFCIAGIPCRLPSRQRLRKRKCEAQGDCAVYKSKGVEVGRAAWGNTWCMQPACRKIKHQDFSWFPETAKLLVATDCSTLAKVWRANV